MRLRASASSGRLKNAKWVSLLFFPVSLFTIFDGLCQVLFPSLVPEFVPRHLLRFLHNDMDIHFRRFAQRTVCVGKDIGTFVSS